MNDLRDLYRDVTCWKCEKTLEGYPGPPWEPICDDCWAEVTLLKEKPDDQQG